MRWLLVLSGVLVCAGQPVGSSCPLQMSPPSVVVRFGDALRVNCSSTADEIELMDFESRYGEKTKGVSSVVLEIRHVKDWDMSPICFINPLNSDQCFKTLAVTVYKTPDSVSISRASPTGSVVEGDTYSLKCDVVNAAPVRNLSVRWYKGDEVFHTEGFDGSVPSPVNATSVVNVTARRGDDQTRIRCEARLDFWATVPSIGAIRSESLAVSVLYPPTFARPQNETLELSAGGEFLLDCAATGNPTPVYSWQALEYQQLTGVARNQSVAVPGPYKCTASNTQGSTTKHFTVTKAPRNRTTFGALVGGFVSLAAVISAVGLFSLTPEGTFSSSRGGYLKGRPASSAPI
ncbi:intercellular adhesion molecule 2-like [Spinachia spinachia]